jgi:Protein of unknown function (DUF3489)
MSTKTKTKKVTATPATKARTAKRTAQAAPLKAKPSPKAADARKPVDAPRGGTKTDKIVDLLKRTEGVTLKELVKATGWRPNSVRGFLSGTIGKKMGTPVESFKNKEGDRSYRLSAQ